MTELGKLKHFHSKFDFGIPLEYYQSFNGSFDFDREWDNVISGKEHSTLKVTSEIQPGSMRGMTNEERVSKMKDDRLQIIALNGKWVRSMVESDSPLKEKMALFWHDHFACKPNFSFTAVSYVDLLRRESLGNFRTMLHAMAKEPAMLLFLNNQQNRKSHPNENFAREVMELFTLGIGHYTEEDIKEAARAFTGWSMTREGKFTIRERQHDFGKKNFFGERRNWTGEEVIDRLLEEEQTAKYVSSKIATYLIGKPPSSELADQLTRIFINSDYEILPVVLTIAESKEFWSDSNVGCDVLSPVELLVKMERDFRIDYQSDLMRLGLQRRLGQILLQPPNVAGWPFGENWIDTATLSTRLGLSRLFILRDELRTGAEPSFAQGEDLGEKLKGFRKMNWTVDISGIEDAWGDLSFSDQVDEIAGWLLPEPKVKDHALLSMIQELDLPDTSHALALVGAMPEYQLK